MKMPLTYGRQPTVLGHGKLLAVVKHRGAVPFYDAKWPLANKPVTQPTSTSSHAAPDGPMLSRATREVPIARTSSRSPLSAAVFRA